jgi:hypothetical protein
LTFGESARIAVLTAISTGANTTRSLLRFGCMFAALLGGPEKNGHWQIAPLKETPHYPAISSRYAGSREQIAEYRQTHAFCIARLTYE